MADNSVLKAEELKHNPPRVLSLQVQDYPDFLLVLVGAGFAHDIFDLTL